MLTKRKEKLIKDLVVTALGTFERVGLRACNQRSRIDDQLGRSIEKAGEAIERGLNEIAQALADGSE